MKLKFEYGLGFMEAELPDDRTDVFIPGETVADPPYLEDPIAATKEAINNPIGMKTVPELIDENSKITIVFPDRVKGGEHKTSHRKVTIRIVLDMLKEIGVKKENILLICSNGLHAKNTKEQIKNILGDEIFNEFWYDGQIINHDSEDYDNLVDLGENEHGDRVIMNKFVYDSDLCFMIGHAQGNPYGGYSGGYKHCSTGITHWKTIATNHVPDVMHKSNFTPVNNKSTMRSKFDNIAKWMEKCMGRKFFVIDAVLDTKARQIAVFAGDGGLVQPPSWDIANKRTYIPFAKEKYDVMIFGMPQFFHYGDGMGTNPIMMMQAVSANVIRHKRVMKDNCVVIVSSACDGWFHDELFTGYREIYEMFQTNQNYILPDLEKYSEYLTTNQDYINNYRYAYGFHPYHGFSMISCGHIAEMNTGAIYICGAREPGYARGMGMKTRRNIEDALKDAERIVGKNPKILALPKTFTTTAVHLMMEDQDPDVEGAYD
ncbi:MAG: lactate racemase domain-containing protein [Saccharofermentanales bacterium]